MQNISFYWFLPLDLYALVHLRLDHSYKDLFFLCAYGKTKITFNLEKSLIIGEIL